jgi:hypothetical protein
MKLKINPESFTKTFLKSLVPFDTSCIFSVEKDCLYSITDHNGDKSNIICSIISCESDVAENEKFDFGINDISKLMFGADSVSNNKSKKKNKEEDKSSPLEFNISNGVMEYNGDKHLFKIQLMNEYLLNDKIKRIPFKKDQILNYSYNVSFSILKEEISSIKRCISFSNHSFLKITNDENECVFRSVADKSKDLSIDEMSFKTPSKSEKPFQYTLNANFIDYLPSIDTLVKINLERNVILFFCVENDSTIIYVLSRIKNS